MNFAVNLRKLYSTGDSSSSSSGGVFGSPVLVFPQWIYHLQESDLARAMINDGQSPQMTTMVKLDDDVESVKDCRAQKRNFEMGPLTDAESFVKLRFCRCRVDVGTSLYWIVDFLGF